MDDGASLSAVQFKCLFSLCAGKPIVRMTGHFVQLPGVASTLDVSVVAFPMRNLEVVQCDLKECPAQGACTPDPAGGGSLMPINAVRKLVAHYCRKQK